MHDSIFHGALNLIEIGHIHLQSERTAAQGLDFGEQPRIRIDVPQPQCYVCPGVGKRQRDRPAKAASRACDEGYPVRKVETGKLVHAVQDTPAGPPLG
jgi:hypothetical protein